MTTTTLRPDSSGSGSMTVVSGGASHHAANSDNSDASYSRTSGVFSNLDMRFGTVAMPAGSLTKQARLRVRGYGESAGVGINPQIRGGSTYFPALSADLSTVIGDRSSAWVAVTLTQRM